LQKKSCNNDKSIRCTNRGILISLKNRREKLVQLVSVLYINGVIKKKPNQRDSVPQGAMTMRSRKTMILAVVVLFLFAASTAFAKITVISVKGKAAFKTGRTWQPLRRGMTLNQGTKVSTGVHSWVKLRMFRSTVTVKPLTMMKIYENSSRKNRIRTRIGLRRGSVRAHVTRGRRVKTVFKISTPVATSSVRGTIEEASHGPSGSSFAAPQGSFDVVSRNGQRGVVFGRLGFNQSGSRRGPMFNHPLVLVNDPNLTGSELRGLFFTGFDNPFGTGGILEILNGTIDGAQILVDIQWPEPGK